MPDSQFISQITFARELLLACLKEVGHPAYEEEWQDYTFKSEDWRPSIEPGSKYFAFYVLPRLSNSVNGVIVIYKNGLAFEWGTVALHYEVTHLKFTCRKIFPFGVIQIEEREELRGHGQSF